VSLTPRQGRARGPGESRWLSNLVSLRSLTVPAPDLSLQRGQWLPRRRGRGYLTAMSRSGSEGEDPSSPRRFEAPAPSEWDCPRPSPRLVAQGRRQQEPSVRRRERLVLSPSVTPWSTIDSSRTPSSGKGCQVAARQVRTNFREQFAYRWTSEPLKCSCSSHRFSLGGTPDGSRLMAHGERTHDFKESIDEEEAVFRILIRDASHFVAP
jgi:hypothetical protein